MMLASNRNSGQGLKTKKKLNLESLDEQQMNASVSCEFGPDGIRFLRNNIKITKEGTAKITGDQILPLSMVSSEEVEFGNEIGRGASGFVQEGIYKPENIPIAIKTMNLYDKDKRHQVVNDLKNFLQDRLESLKGNYTELSNHLVQVYGAYYDEGSIKIIMELMDAGSLRGLLNMAKKLKATGPYIDEPYLANIAYQILSGLYFIHHRKKQIHRDIKPENILINSLGQAKLTDFGISKQLEQTQGFSKTFVGTVTYMSPERLKGEPYAFSSDLWSLGLLLIELASGEYPYQKTKTFIEMLQNITTLPEPNLPDNGLYSEELRDFIRRCLSKDPLKRGTANELMEHPWLVKNSELNYDLSEWVRNVIYAYKNECANEENAKAPQLDTIAEEFNNNTPNQSQAGENLYTYDQVSNLLNSYAMSGNVGSNNMGNSNMGMFGQIETNNSGLYCSESISEMPQYQHSTGLGYYGGSKKVELDLEVENLE